jgi:hypothetical protein
MREIIDRLLSNVIARVQRVFGTRDYVGSTHNRSISDNGLYVAAVKKAALKPGAFNRFKRNPHYRKILEHTTYEQGLVYLEIVSNQAPEFLRHTEEIKLNDLVGGATTFDFPAIGSISPSTLRYLKVTSDIENLFGNEIKGGVAEIGVGYGGQLLVADRFLSFKEWQLFDLPPVLELASKYLECHVLKNSYSTSTLNQLSNDRQWELVLSNYAFSELPSKLQIQYLRKLMSKAARGYLTMNSGAPDSLFQGDHLSVSELKNYLPPFEILPEYPLTCPGNYVIVWGRQ